jgi:phosphate-selective porin
MAESWSLGGPVRNPKGGLTIMVVRWLRRGAIWLAMGSALLLGLGPTARASAEDGLEPFFRESRSNENSEGEFDSSADADLGSSSEETPQPSPNTQEFQRLKSRIEQLEQAEKRRAEADRRKKEDDKKKKDEETRKAEDWQDLSNDKWNVRLGGHVQMEEILWPSASDSIQGAENYFEFRRLRLVADGTGYGVYDFRLQMTLEPPAVGDVPTGGLIPEVKDAYFSINEIPLIGRARIGNFFVPFGLEQVTNDTMNVFLERSIPTQGVFTPDREVGIAAYNCTEDQRATVSYGIFLDSVSESLKERIDDNQGFRISGRGTWLPYYDESSNGRYLVHTGMGVLYSQDQDGVIRVRTRPEIHEGPRLIDSGNLAAGSSVTGNLEGAVVWGPVTVQSEAYLCQVNRFQGENNLLHGAYVHASWFLTGENRVYERFGQHGAQFGRPLVYTNVFATPGGLGLGAWELKSRLSYLNLNDVNRGVLTDYTVGCNWYWSDRVRIMCDWIHPITTASTVFGATTSNILGLRFDFNW